MDKKDSAAVVEELKQLIHDADSLYHRLVLVVGKSGSGKTGALQCVAAEFGTSVININLALSSELLELTAKQRSLGLPAILNQVADKTGPPVVLDNLEILFDKNLKQDPLRLLQGISRNSAVIASWNGTFDRGRLLYAEIGHPEYRCYDSIDTLVVNLEDK